jgi:hypothetical protein
MTPMASSDFNDNVLFKSETFLSKVEVLELSEQLKYCEKIIVQCQTLYGQTAVVSRGFKLDRREGAPSKAWKRV